MLDSTKPVRQLISLHAKIQRFYWVLLCAKWMFGYSIASRRYLAIIQVLPGRSVSVYLHHLQDNIFFDVQNLSSHESARGTT